MTSLSAHQKIGFDMFGSLGIGEIALIFVAALLLFGPRKLPEIGRAIGKGLGEFRKASNDLKRAFNAETALEDDEPRPPLRGGRLAGRPPELANRGPISAAVVAAEGVTAADAETEEDPAADARFEAAEAAASTGTVARQPDVAETPGVGTPVVETSASTI